MRVLLGFLLVVGCGGNPSAEQSAEAESIAESETIHPAAPTAPLMLEVPARTVAAPGSEARPTAPYPARILAVHVRPGDTVEVGAPLFDVSMPEVLRAVARLSSTSARSALRAARRQELEDLRGEGLVDRSRIFEEEAELASLGAERAEALAVLRSASLSLAEGQAALRTGRTTLRSPIRGVVRDVFAALGEMREPGSGPLATIVADVPARIEARFAERPPDTAAFIFRSLEGTEVALSDAPVSRVMDPEDGTFVLFLEPAEPVSLPPNSNGRVRASLPTADVTVIPSSALLISEGGVHVLRTHGERTERAAVNVLELREGRASVRGLSIDDSIVVHPPRDLGLEE